MSREKLHQLALRVLRIEHAGHLRRPWTPDARDAAQDEGFDWRATRNLWCLQDHVGIFMARRHVVTLTRAVDVVEMDRHEVPVEQCGDDRI